jgi:hypothetical protein
MLRSSTGPVYRGDMLRPILIALAFAAAFALAPSTARCPSAWADTPSDGGVPLVANDLSLGSSSITNDVTHVSAAPTGSAAPAPADTVHNPVTSPAAAYDEVKEAKRTSWPLLVWLALVMLGKALAYSADALAKAPIIGKLAAWLAKGKAAMAVAALGAVGAAGYNVLVNGGTVVAALVASGAAIGGVLHSTTRTPAT